MKGYEAAKKLGITSGEFCEQYDLGSHMQKIPDELEAELFGSEKKIMEEQACTETVDSAETVLVDVEASLEAEVEDEAQEDIEEDGKEDIEEVVEESIEEVKPVLKCPVDLETLKTSLRGCGNKSPYWEWRHLVG